MENTFLQEKQMALEITLAGMYCKVVDQLAAVYQGADGNGNPGCIPWIEINRPDIERQISQANNQANQTWLDCLNGVKNVEQVKAALVAWYKAYRQGIVAYSEYLSVERGA
jgi:hypothetical protein